MVSQVGSSDDKGNLGIHIIKGSEIQAAEFKAERYLGVFVAFQHKEIFLLHG